LLIGQNGLYREVGSDAIEPGLRGRVSRWDDDEGIIMLRLESTGQESGGWFTHRAVAYAVVVGHVVAVFITVVDSAVGNAGTAQGIEEDAFQS
jgi:hypothetical protein